MSNEIIDLENQIAELTAKKKAILNSKRGEALQEVRALIVQYSLMASELGFSAIGKPASSAPKAAPKYANPKSPAETWAGGKGARPKWVREFLENGGNLDDLLIQKA